MDVDISIINTIHIWASSNVTCRDVSASSGLYIFWIALNFVFVLSMLAHGPVLPCSAWAAEGGFWSFGQLHLLAEAPFLFSPWENPSSLSVLLQGTRHSSLCRLHTGSCLAQRLLNPKLSLCSPEAHFCFPHLLVRLRLPLGCSVCFLGVAGFWYFSNHTLIRTSSFSNSHMHTLTDRGQDFWLIFYSLQSFFCHKSGLCNLLFLFTLLHGCHALI